MPSQSPIKAVHPPGFEPHRPVRRHRSNLSTASAPPAQLDHLGKSRQRRVLENATNGQRANDDTRVPPAEEKTRLDLFDSADSVVMPERPQRMLTGFATIANTRFNNLPVFRVRDVGDDQLTVQTLGTPVVTITVFYDKATFNNVSLRDFRVKEVLKQGDHILVDRIGDWYNKKTKRVELQSTAVHFPRYSDGRLGKGDRWIVDGTIDMIVDERNGDRMIDTDVQLAEGKSVLLRAPLAAFPRDNPDEDCSVFARALLVGGDGLAFSKTAAGPDTPWEAESVALVADGIHSGRGYLKRNKYGTKSILVVAKGFGYVYVPPHLITKDLDQAQAESEVEFEATIAVVHCEDKKMEEKMKIHKWRAVSIRMIKQAAALHPVPVPNGLDDPAACRPICTCILVCVCNSSQG